MKSDPISPTFLDSLWGFLLKILGLSVLISIGIKTIGPFLPLPQTNAVALGLVLTPTIVMVLLLGLRSQSR